ncbi:MAG: hypothetical protein HYT15_03085 [Candidatus Magasanikbacteria bacterium]|nr:hypothetical protein [Candidatus Magasanikbacteria bacterium]
MLIIQIVGISLDVVGTILIAYTVLRVHDRVRKERRIDLPVTKEMVTERTMVIVGIALILIGYIFQLIWLFI